MINMNLIEIEKKLTELGYLTMYRPIIKTLFCAISNNEGNPIEDSTTHIELVDEKIKFTSFDNQLSKIEFFDSYESLENALKENYPLN